MDLGLGGRTVLVTGGSSGIGLAVIRALLAEGASVTTCARGEARLRAAVSPLDGRRCLAIAADVMDPSEMAAVVEASVGRFGRLDAVAAIAGHGLHGHALELGTDDWQRELMAKVGGVLNVVRPAREHLRRSDGARIVTVTSPMARRSSPQMAAVSAARAAVANLTRSLALDLVAEGISVNSVAIGLIDTPRQEERHRLAGTEQSYGSWLQHEAEARGVPLGRPGTAVEVARVVVFALSPAMSYTTGSTLDATGGGAGCHAPVQLQKNEATV